MTTAEQFRSSTETGTTHQAHREVSIAGVPWPAYKVLAVALALAMFGVVTLVTADAAAAVLTATAVATVVWIGGSARLHRGH